MNITKRKLGNVIRGEIVKFAWNGNTHICLRTLNPGLQTSQSPFLIILFSTCYDVGKYFTLSSYERMKDIECEVFDFNRFVLVEKDEEKIK